MGSMLLALVKMCDCHVAKGISVSLELQDHTSKPLASGRYKNKQKSLFQKFYF